MAEALVKYETIDSDQIQDIMAGRSPRPPDGWDDSEPRPGGGAHADGGEQPSRSGPKGPIGGPAEQH